MKRPSKMPHSDFKDLIGRVGRKTKIRASKATTAHHRGSYKVPDWFKSIKVGSHGNTPTQKRAWRVVSEYVRKRDFELYGKCVSCGVRFERWEDGQAGHYKSWGASNSWFKYNTKNIFLQCAGCNGPMAGASIGHPFGEEIIRRYGEEHLNWIETENEKYRGMKMEEWELVEMVQKLAPHLVK